MTFEVTATYEEPAYDHRSRVKSSAQKAERYRHRPAAKPRAEMALVRRGMALVDGVDTVLDAPCGVGRATIMLAQMGYQATGADLGEGAIRLARLEVAQAGVPAIMQAMLDEVAPKLKTGIRMLSQTVRADAREGDIGTQLGEIAKANPDVAIGSYPFFDPQHGPNTNVVLRARDAEKLALAARAVEDGWALCHFPKGMKMSKVPESSEVCPDDGLDVTGISVDAATSYFCSGDPAAFPKVGDASTKWWKSSGFPSVKYDGTKFAVLPYGKKLIFDHFICASEKAGVTCANTETGAGFRVALAGVTLIK